MSKDLQNVHIIAIGGAVMSSLAIALKQNGIQVSGSDDKIYDPAKKNLATNDLLPEKEGWNPDLIHSELDAVIVGMHAKQDNPELLKAQELGLDILSYPEFIRSQSNNKQRVVIAGSHGKTTITSMVVHVLNYYNKPVDYLIGAKIKGIDNTIKLSDAPVIIIEGDEYFTSPLDHSPKFLKYDHHITLISGTSWDHYNVYPTLDSYIEQFKKLIDMTPKAGSIVYSDDKLISDMIGSKEREDVKPFPYTTPNYKVKDGVFILKNKDEEYPLKVFGKHNLQNMEGARLVLDLLGITEQQFFEAIQSYEGAAKRNTLIKENETSSFYSDFAHAPSKLKATVNALKELHPKRKLTACFELHTFSSLNKDFLPQFEGKIDEADEAIIFIDKNNSKLKDGPTIEEEDIKKFFKREDLLVITSSNELESHISSQTWSNHNLLLMSSGNYDNLDIKKLADQIIA